MKKIAAKILRVVSLIIKSIDLLYIGVPLFRKRFKRSACRIENIGILESCDPAAGTENTRIGELIIGGRRRNQAHKALKNRLDPDFAHSAHHPFAERGIALDLLGADGSAQALEIAHMPPCRRRVVCNIILALRLGIAHILERQIPNLLKPRRHKGDIVALKREAVDLLLPFRLTPERHRI